MPYSYLFNYFFEKVVTLAADVSPQVVAKIPSNIKAVRLTAGVTAEIVQQIPGHINEITINGGIKSPLAHCQGKII
jgi:hypothetical protein